MTARAGVTKPLPVPTAISAPFWSAAARHELILQSCQACERLQTYPRVSCTNCGSTDLGWRAASGRGTVYSYTVARVPTHPAFADEPPLVIAIVELEEGPRLTTNIVGDDDGRISIGAPVEVVFADVADGISLPKFQLASEPPRTS